MLLKRLLLVSGLFTLLLMILIMIHGTPLKTYPASPRGIISLELAQNPDTASAILEAWRPNLILLARQNTYIDFFFLTAYGVFLCTLCLLVSHWFGGLWKRAGKWIAIAMLIAAFFDATENILMLKTLKGSLGKELVASTYMFASVKFLLVGFGILYIIFSLTGKIMRPRHAKAKQPANLTSNL